MAETSITTVITLRQGTTEQWANENSVRLADGEMGLEYCSDGSVKIKAGKDGKHWNELSYVGGDLKAAEVYQSEILPASNEDDDDTVIAALVSGKAVQNGDIAIVKRYITGDTGAISYTSYVYDSDLGWAATDGNYSATNVFLKKGITLSGDYGLDSRNDKITSIGNYRIGDTISAGTSLESVLSGLFQQELNPVVTNTPSVSISASGGTQECGNSYSAPTATLKIDDVGAYPYAPTATGITFEAGNVKLAEGADPATATNYKVSDAVMAANSTLTLTAEGSGGIYSDTAKSYTFSGTATHTDGVVPVTNLGNPYPDAQIKSASVTIADKTVTFSGFRYAFAGGTTAAALDSATIRAMTAKKNGFSAMDSQSEALEFTAAAGATKVFFAYPSNWSVGTKKPYFEMFGLAWAENTDIVAKDDVQVADSRGTNEDGTLNGAIAYKVYCWELDTPLQAESTKFRVWFK